jgi:hypothetical protein
MWFRKGAIAHDRFAASIGPVFSPNRWKVFAAAVQALYGVAGND